MMPYNRAQARKLLTAAEFELFEHSFGADKTLTTARLRAKVARARQLRDKFRDLYRRQRLALRGATGAKGGRSGAANERTQRKAVVFGEALARLQVLLARREAADARAAKKATARASAAARPARPAKPARRGPQRIRSPKAPAKAAPKSSVPASAKPAPSGPPAAQRSNPLLNPRNKAISAHVRSQGRRNQARRDRR